MGPVRAIRSTFRQFASFDGRARRAEFWWWVAFVNACWVALVVIGVLVGELFGDQYGMPIAFLAVIVILAAIIPTLALRCRRLHDFDASGWWQLLILVPVVNWFVDLVFGLAPGSAGPNRFGPDPRIPAGSLPQDTVAAGLPTDGTHHGALGPIPYTAPTTGSPEHRDDGLSGDAYDRRGF